MVKVGLCILVPEFLAAALLSICVNYIAVKFSRWCLEQQHKAVYKRFNKRKILFWIFLQEWITFLLLKLMIFPVIYGTTERPNIADLLYKNRSNVKGFLKFIVLYLITLSIIYYHNHYYPIFAAIHNIKNYNITAWIFNLEKTIQTHYVLTLLISAIILLILYLISHKRKLFLNGMTKLQDEETYKVILFHKKLYGPVSKFIMDNADTLEKVLNYCEKDDCCCFERNQKSCFWVEKRLEREYPGIKILDGEILKREWPYHDIDDEGRCPKVRGN